MLNGQNLSWTHVPAEVPKGFILVPLLFLTYINDLSDHLSSNKKLANDTSLFWVIHDVNTSVDELNGDWAVPWKTSFNPDSS